ncbi:MAG: hypothetical protein MJ032_04365 [Acidaminococcaceae bacterium]|nr:hypothetical protein [Acidaminococcaceae bacterium]
MDLEYNEKEFKKYLEKFQKEPELTKLLNKVTFVELFTDKFLQENSKWKDMDDLVFRGDFGIMNLWEVENVNQDAWNAYVAKNCECTTWHDFGKLAMLCWMREKYKTWKDTQK